MSTENPKISEISTFSLVKRKFPKGVDILHGSPYSPGMAKLSARGATEVGKFRAVRNDPEGSSATFLFALRSDGAVLRRLISVTETDGSVHKLPSGYKVFGTLKADVSITALRAIIARKGYEVAS